MKQAPIIKTFSFSYYMTMAVVVSFFPVYFDSLGYSKLQIGSLYSIGPTMGIVSNLFWGLISDRFQTLKKTILAVLFGQLAMLLLLFHTDIYTTVFIIMMGFYFFQTPLNGLNDSQILLMVRETGKSYASFRVWGSIGFAVSALTFGLAFAKFSISVIAPLTIGCVTLSISLAFFLRERRQSMKRMDFSGVWKIVFSRRLLIFLLLIFVMAISHRTNDGFMALYLKDMGAGQDWIGFASTASALSEIPVFFLLSRFGHRYQELPLLALACFVYAVRFLLMSYASTPQAVVGIQLMHSFSFGIFLFTALRYMQELVPDEYRATGQAVFNITWGGFAGLFSGFIGGHVYDAWGGVTLYRFASAAAVAACIGFLVTYVLQQRESPVEVETRIGG